MKKIIITIGLCLISTISTAQVRLKYFSNKEVAAMSATPSNPTGIEQKLYKYDNAATAGKQPGLYKYNNADVAGKQPKLYKYNNADVAGNQRELRRFAPHVDLKIIESADSRNQAAQLQTPPRTFGKSNNLNYDGKNQPIKK